MTPIETAVFWHKPIAGGAPVASSVVGQAPLDLPAAHANAVRLTGYGQATGMSRDPALLFQRFEGGTPLENVRKVSAAYDGCARCHLCASRMSVVHCRGNPDAALVFLGEGPGKDENDLGKPFIGRSGKLQDEIARLAGLDPERDIFWMNVVGCRPGQKWGDDRAPTKPELIACAEHTYLLLQAVRPRVVVCLGKVATEYFFAEKPPVWSFNKFVPQGVPNDWVMVAYGHHPAYLVRVIGTPSQYKEYAAQRTFYGTIASHLRSGIRKVDNWLFLPRYLSDAKEPMIAWADGAKDANAVDEPAAEETA